MTEAKDTIIREFLIQPHNRRIFNDFYKFCYNYTKGYLHYLKRKNYQFPYDERTDKDPIDDLAIDILGFFLANKKNKQFHLIYEHFLARKNNKPFHVIYDYFSQHGINNFQSQSPEKLNDMFVVLLKGFIKKQLFKFKQSTNPQIENLKRRFKDIIRDSEVFKTLYINGTDYVYLESDENNLQDNNPLIPYNELESIALKYFIISKNTSQWCLNILSSINRLTEYRNMVSKYLLLTAVVKVNAEYIDSGEFFTHQASSTKSAWIISFIENAFETALDNLKSKTLPAYLKKQVISVDESELIYLACRNYLTDYCAHSGNTDPIPVYFREMMPLETHERYLKDYKNIFESSIKKMLAYFKNELKNISTSQRLG